MKLTTKFIVLTILCTLTQATYSMIPTELLFKYAKENKARKLKQLLDENPSMDVNTPNHAAQTPLHTAAEYNNTKVAILLLDRGAHINALDCTGKTPLHYAALDNSVEVATLLLERGADGNIQCLQYKDTALHVAVEDINVEAVSCLMNNILIDVSVTNTHNNTALDEAIENSTWAEDGQEIVTIIQHKQQENTKMLRFLFFAIKFALENNRQKTFAGLIKNNRRIALALREAKTGNNILHLAIATRKPHLIEIALKYLPELAGIKNEKDNKTPLALPAAQPFLIKQILNHKLSKICQEHVVIAQLIESSSLETSLLGVKKRITRQLALAA